MSEKTATGKELEELVNRVWKGILFYATEETIRQQLRTEGYSDQTITLAYNKAKRSHDAREAKV
jgi:hypothetical protein